MGAAHDALEHALALGAQRLPDAETGARELAGYERFLRYAGTHLHTLMRLAEVRDDGTRRLVERLNSVTETEPTAGPTGGRWLQAAALLGTAHDLLATHLTGVDAPRTAEGEELLAGPEVVASCVEVAQLILSAVDGTYDLLHRTARAQNHSETKVVPTRTFTRLHASNRAASLYARAALWDLNRAAGGVSPTRLSQLRPAIRLDAPVSPEPPGFGTTLAALRLLRHYSYTQARGLAAASPASLRDLALLGARITDPEPTLSTLPEPATPLERVQHAHLADQLTAAQNAWTAASDELTRAVQGLTKAPAGYGAAIHQLHHADLAPTVRRAIGSALPRMGAEAAASISHLAQRSELVTLQRPPLKTRHEWRPILPEHAAAIAENFTTAAHASRRAFTTLAGLNSPHQRAEAQRPQNRLRLERQLQVRR